MNGPPDLPIDAIPMPIPEPAVPLPPVRTPVATEPPGEPATEAGPAVGAPAPQPRWVGEAVRDLLTVSRKKLVVLTTAGSVVAVGLALNALFTGIGLTPPETPNPEQPAEPASLAAAPAEPPAPETRQSEAATIPPEPQTVEPIAIAGVQPPDLRSPAPSAVPATGIPSPAIPDIPKPDLSTGGPGTAVAPASILPAGYTEPAPVTPAPKPPAEVKSPTTPPAPGGVGAPSGIPAPIPPPIPTIDPKTLPDQPRPNPTTPAPETTGIKPSDFKPLEVVPPAVPAVGDVTRPGDKKDGPAARSDAKGMQPVTLTPELMRLTAPMSEEKKAPESGIPPPSPLPVVTLPDQTPSPTRTTPAAGQIAAPGDLPARVIAPTDGGRPPELKDAIPTPPSPFKPVPAGDDKPTGGSLNLTKPPGEIGVRPATSQERPKTDFDVDLHKPKAGDTYESISKLHYRDARYANALRQFNRGVELDRGIDVHVPPMYVLRKEYPQLIAPARSSPGITEWAPSAGRERK